MTLSIGRRIDQNVVATLAAITVANGYQTDVLAVLEGLITPDGQPTPFLCVHRPEPETYEELAYPLITRMRTYRIFGCVQAQEGAGHGREAEIEKLLADLEKALLADRTRGGLAVDTRLLSNQVWTDEPGEPWNEVQLAVRVHYRTKRGDPFTVA